MCVCGKIERCSEAKHNYKPKQGTATWLYFVQDRASETESIVSERLL